MAAGPETLALLETWQAQVAAASRSVLRALGADFLVDVLPTAQWRGPSELMRRDHRFQKIGRLWRMLRETPFVAIHSPAFDLPVSDLPTLYEQWCLLQVVRALMKVGTVRRQSLLRQDTTGAAGSWKVQLVEDLPLLVLQSPGCGDIRLFYRRRYRPEYGLGQRFGSLDPYLRVPDIAIELARPGRPPAVLICDAKYRIAPSGGVPEDALGDAYTYHAAIGYAGRPASIGALLLFPGRQGFETEGVGAIPLRPGDVGPLDDMIARRLRAYLDGSDDAC